MFIQKTTSVDFLLWHQMISVSQLEVCTQFWTLMHTCNIQDKQIHDLIFLVIFWNLGQIKYLLFYKYHSTCTSKCHFITNCMHLYLRTCIFKHCINASNASYHNRVPKYQQFFLKSARTTWAWTPNKVHNKIPRRDQFWF